MAHRRVDRESGIGEDPGDETLAQIDVGDETINQDPDVQNLPQELPGQPIADNQPLPQPDDSSTDDDGDFQDADDDMAQAQEVTAQQLATIPVYDGVRGESFINWIELVENAISAYRWNHTGGFSAVKVKGGPKVSEWLRSQRLQGITYNSWAPRDPVNANDRPVKADILKRFGPRYTAASAVTAVSALKQRDSETVADFMDRVVLAADKMFNNLPDAVRTSDEFKQTMTRTSLSLFGAGLKNEISKIVLAQSEAPATIPAMLAAAEAVEIEQGKKPTATHPSVYAVKEPSSTQEEEEQEEDDYSNNEELETLKEDFEELCLAVSKQIDLSKIRCYNCQRFGHFASSCLAPRRGRGRGGFASRRGNRGRRPTRREFRARPFGPTRALMAVEDDQDEQDDDYDQYGFQTPQGNC